MKIEETKEYQESFFSEEGLKNRELLNKNNFSGISKFLVIVTVVALAVMILTYI